ncbi:GTP cyclohydrolase II RibA [Pseudarthrobacter sp. C4D7]|uniref:GTP cyclohydrolase II RibA n=1 Tax=Pseudarthrobacter sp. C4D7 TaxID=2735268 RepID=UPI0015857B3B|nr:GTP cyclohydrolase II RibA [Pseudarthrobacter sp. C4D7]NUT70869.1 GTP cyclohydrolase II RibA [Pseudarthrobacter sp. C4D7]
MTTATHELPLNSHLPRAVIRTRVSVPLRFPDGYAASADVMTFHGLADGREHLLLALGGWEQALLDGGKAPLVRLHSECMTGDVFGSERCDCGPQLREAVEKIAAAGGFLLYLRQEGRGIGLYSKLDAYALQDQGLDTYDANLALGHGEDERDYTAAAQMLSTLGATTVRLLSNNPDKAHQLAALGIGIQQQVPTGVHLSAANSRYLAAKRDRTGHTLELGQAAVDHAPQPTAGPEAARPDMPARAAALVPGLRARAEETERLRRLPASTVQELQDAGVFRILAPVGAGGYGLGARTYGEVVRVLARGCASTAWTAGHLAEHAWMLARWPRAVQDEVFAGGQVPLAAATSAPPGRAWKVPGGYAISGHWSFASGVMHSQWALLAVNLDGTRMQALVPVAELDLLDAWHTDGLRGTGSNDLRADGLFVPGHRVAEWALLSSPENPGSLVHHDPLIHAPMATLLNLVAPAAALGSAEYAVELFREQLLVPKTKNGINVRQADSALAQARFARVSGALAAAQQHWEAALSLLPPEGHADAGMSESPRASFRLSLALSADASQEAVRLAVGGSGGSMHRLAHPLQRIQRDVGVILNHPTLGIDPILEQAGRGLLGLGIAAPSF